LIRYICVATLTQCMMRERVRVPMMGKSLEVHYRVTNDSIGDSKVTNEFEPGVITKLSPRSVSETVARLVGILTTNGVQLFAVIDQREAARNVGLDLRETTLVIFGNPRAGTPIMSAKPLAALDLPLKLLVWADDQQTKVSYYSPSDVAARHHLSDELAHGLGAIDALSDALVAP
jgi:uncharacterized protein (DUF302 family)